MPPANHSPTIRDEPRDDHLPTTRDEAIEQVLVLNASLRDNMLYFTRRNHRIELAILVLTVLTTGAFWVLISQSLEHAAAWAGGIISTVTTGLTIYQLSLGPKKVAETEIRLQKQTDDLLIWLREQSKSESEFNSEETQRRIKEPGGEAIREVLSKKPRHEWTVSDQQLWEQSFRQ